MPDVADFTSYTTKPKDWLLSQLAIVVSEIYNAHIVHGATLQSEKSARVRGFMASEETTVSGRERDAEAQALPLTLGLYEMQAQIRALTEERDLLLLLIGERRAAEDRPVGDAQRLFAGDQVPDDSVKHHPSAFRNTRGSVG